MQRKKINEQSLIEALIEYLNSGLQFEAFESMTKGTDNTKAQIFQFKGDVPLGQYFLCDCIGNTVDLCLATNRKYKNPAGRPVNCRVVATIIFDARKTLGSPVNGEWMIPWNKIKI